MSNAKYYKALGIKPGDSLSGEQLAQIAGMKARDVDGVKDLSPDPTPREVTDEDIGGALDLLEMGNDDHWTKVGLPSMAAVENLLGTDTIKRADVERVRPDLIRVEA